MELLCPSTWTVDSVSRFLRNANQYLFGEELFIDMRHYDFGTPLPIMLMASGIRDMQVLRRKRQLVTSLRTDPNNKKAEYLAHIGFFRLIRYSIGKEPGEAVGNANYLPITLVWKSDIERRRGQDTLGDTVKAYSEELAERIFRQDDEQFQHMMLAYSLQEVLRNVFEHAEINVCAVMAQGWRNGWMEIVVADRGIGLYKSLGQKYALASVDQALRMSLQPGVSRIPEHELAASDNAGFGLHVLSNMGRQYGEFGIASGDRLLTISKEGNGAVSLHDILLSGTAVRLSVNTADADYFPNFLKLMVQQGEAAMDSPPINSGGLSKTLGRRNRGS